MKRAAGKTGQDLTLDQVAVSVMERRFPPDTFEFLWGETARHAFDHLAGDRRDDGNIPAISELLQHAINYPQEDREQMICSARNNVFEWAAKNGHLNIVNLLIEFTPDQTLKQTMIHGDSDMSFKLAAENGHLDVINRLIELTPNVLRQTMIHGHGDSAFKRAAENGHFDIANLLIELTPNEALRQNMISRAINRTPDFTRLLKIIFDEPHNQNDKKTTELKELRGELILHFGGDDGNKKANTVIAALLSGDALGKAGKYFTDLSLTRHLEAKAKEAAQSSSSSSSLPPRPPVELLQNTFSEISHYAAPIDFPTLSKSDKETALNTLAEFFNRPAERIL